MNHVVLEGHANFHTSCNLSLQYIVTNIIYGHTIAVYVDVDMDIDVDVGSFLLVATDLIYVIDTYRHLFLSFY